MMTLTIAKDLHKIERDLEDEKKMRSVEDNSIREKLVKLEKLVNKLERKSLK